MTPAVHRKVSWLELFFDLAFVAAVAQVGAPLGAEYTPAGLVRYSLLFLLIWWAWNGHTNFATRFDSGDAVQRVLTLTQIFVVAVMAVNAKEALDSRSSAGFAAAYAVLRLLLAGQYWRAGAGGTSRGLAAAYAMGFGAAAILWLVSAVVPPPVRFVLWGAALLLDVGTPLRTAHLTVHAPPDAAHLPERFGLFTIILLGESMVAVMKGMESQAGWNAPAAVAAFLGISIAFLVWWWYFDGARAASDRVVRSKSQARTFMLWSFSHFPLYLGIAVTGVGIEHIIRIAPEGHLHGPEVWILLGAVSILMAALLTIEASSEARRTDGAVWSLAARYTMAVLPLAAAPFGSAVPPVLLAGAIATVLLVQLAAAVSTARLVAIAPQRGPA